MEVTYISTYADLWRCTVYALMRRRDVLWRLAFPIFYGVFALRRHSAPKGWPWLLVAIFVMMLVMSVILAVVLQIIILCRVLMPDARRRCTSEITPQCFTDITLRKTKSIPWAAISEIRYHNGDVFFWQKGKDGNFVPKSAFYNVQQSRTFYETALGFWNAAKSGRFASPPSEGVWPPPPRL